MFVSVNKGIFKIKAVKSAKTLVKLANLILNIVQAVLK